MVKLCAVSVDLDEIDCYAAIHGLSPTASDRTGLRAVYERALPRLVSLFDELRIPVTFFAIGRDLVHADNCARLRALSTQGHEIGNHTLNHYYDLTRRRGVEQRAEVAGGADAIEAATGTRPVGFRAPGYTMTDALFEVLAREGVLYDSSVFPCPGYYLAKTAAIGWIRARGRKSFSVVDHPRVLCAPVSPYRIGRPYVSRGEGLVELPVGVTSALTGRLPYIGTSLVMGGARGARMLTRALGSRAFVNLELHGIDLADSHEDQLTWLASHQPDLKRSASAKRSALGQALSMLRERGYSFVTLAEAARRA